MNFKRVISCILAVLTVTTPIVGCSNNNDTKNTGKHIRKEKTELQIAVFEGGYGSKYWYKVAELFEKEHPDVNVIIQANSEINSIIQPNIFAGTPPDFIYLPVGEKTGIIEEMIANNELADISDVMLEVKDRFLPGFLDTKPFLPSEDGKTYVGPFYYSSMGLWYNKTFFKQNHLEVPVTWDEFFALGEKSKEYGRALFTYQGIHPSYMESMIIPTIASFGGKELIDRCFACDPSAWKDPKIKTALQNIADIGRKGYLLEGTLSMSHMEAQSEWLAGKALFHPNGAWIEHEMENVPREEGFEFGFTAAPVLDAESTKLILTRIEGMFIPAKSKNIDLAKEFLKFQYSDEAIALNAQYAKGIPPIKGAAELLKEYVSPAVYETYTIFEKGYTPYVGNFDMSSGHGIEQRDAFYNPLGDVMSGKLSVDDWIQHMVDISE